MLKYMYLSTYDAINSSLLFDIGLYKYFIFYHKEPW